MKLTNVSNGPRAVWNGTGYVDIGKGETVEVDLPEAELASAKASGWFSFDGHDAKPSLTGKNKADLLAIAEAESVEIEDGATNDDIRSAIELARGE